MKTTLRIKLSVAQVGGQMSRWQHGVRAIGNVGRPF